MVSGKSIFFENSKQVFVDPSYLVRTMMENNSSAVSVTLSLHPTGSSIVRFQNQPFFSRIPTGLTQSIFLRTSQGHHTRRRTLWRTRWISVYRFHCQNCKLGSLEEHHLSGIVNLSKTSTPLHLFVLLRSSTSRPVVKKLSKNGTNSWKRTLAKTEHSKLVRLSWLNMSRLPVGITCWRSSRKLRAWEAKD